MMPAIQNKSNIPWLGWVMLLYRSYAVLVRTSDGWWYGSHQRNSL